MSIAMMCNGSGRRVSVNGLYMELVAHDEEQGAMVIESIRKRLGGVLDVDAMVLAKVFMRENVGGASENHDGACAVRTVVMVRLSSE
jgi:hypothetical protein